MDRDTIHVMGFFAILAGACVMNIAIVYLIIRALVKFVWG